MSIDRLNAAYQAQSQARQLKTEDARKEAALVSEIDGLNAEIELNRENVAKTKELSKQRVTKSEELLLIRARLAVASVRLDGSTALIARAQAGASIAPNIVDRADAITDLAEQIDAKLLMSIFPEGWDAFPNLRVGFMEGGTGWIPMVIDRLNREREYGELRCEKPVVDYFNSGRFYVGCEGSEGALSYVVNLIGPQACMFASDFPHEIAMENALDEINEIEERKDLSDQHKKMILGGNAKKLYKL